MNYFNIKLIDLGHPKWINCIKKLILKYAWRVFGLSIKYDMVFSMEFKKWVKPTKNALLKQET